MPAPTPVSDPSCDLSVIIELPPLSEDQAHCGQLLVQECERQGKKKTVALATFVPRYDAVWRPGKIY